MRVRCAAAEHAGAFSSSSPVFCSSSSGSRRLGCLLVADRTFGTGWPPAVGRLLPLGSQPQFRAMTCRAAAARDGKQMQPRKPPKKPPSQPPIDVPTRIDSSTSSRLTLTVRLMITGFTTAQTDQNHDHDRDRELVRALTNALVLAVGKRAARQALRHARAKAHPPRSTGSPAPPLTWQATARCSATSGTSGGRRINPQPDRPGRLGLAVAPRPDRGDGRHAGSRGNTRRRPDHGHLAACGAQTEARPHRRVDGQGPRSLGGGQRGQFGGPRARQGPAKRQSRSYSSWRWIQVCHASPSSRPSGTRSRTP